MRPISSGISVAAVVVNLGGGIAAFSIDGMMWNEAREFAGSSPCASFDEILGRTSAEGLVWWRALTSR